ncbi:MAG: tryptophan--tRNA ligase [Erysipelothrix sp.]|nr:tryptophan--tRNA ligase [Erysipelothrix sp.]
MNKMISGIKPTGQMHLGNYIGALKPFVSFQDEYDVSVFIANLHCITMPIDPKELKTNLEDALIYYLAVGLDPDKTTIFLQSDVLEHAQLGFILSTLTSMGELNRQTQYKDKRESKEPLSAGFYTYPTLMASDILIHQVKGVPVGDDQKQHVELARDLAERFNNRFGQTFIVPEPITPKLGGRIMSLSDPMRKMSKSDTQGDKGVIYLGDDLKKARKKIMSAQTDSDTKVYFDKENKPGISNLLTIYASLTNTSIEAAEEKFKSHQYGAFKKEVADVVIEELEMIQDKYHTIKASGVLEEVLEAGANKARIQAQRTLKTVQKKMGLELK